MTQKKLEILENSRQIPKIPKYCGNKAYNDNLYGYLQANSIPKMKNKKDIEYRFIPYDYIVISKLAKALGISRPTLYKQLNYLLDIDLLRKDEENKRYILPTLASEEAHLMVEPLLQQLLTVLQKQVISVYVYLFNRWFAAGQKPYEFSHGQVKKFLGLKEENYQNKTVSLALATLKKLEILDYNTSTQRNEDGTVKTVSTLIWIRNEATEIKGEFGEILREAIAMSKK